MNKTLPDASFNFQHLCCGCVETRLCCLCSDMHGLTAKERMPHSSWVFVTTTGSAYAAPSVHGKHAHTCMLQILMLLLLLGPKLSMVVHEVQTPPGECTCPTAISVAIYSGEVLLPWYAWCARWFLPLHCLPNARALVPRNAGEDHPLLVVRTRMPQE